MLTAVPTSVEEKEESGNQQVASSKMSPVANFNLLVGSSFETLTEHEMKGIFQRTSMLSNPKPGSTQLSHHRETITRDIPIYYNNM